MSFAFANGGNFKRTGVTANGDGIAATGSATIIPMTTIGFVCTGTNGATNTPSTLIDLTGQLVPGTYTFDSGLQTAATVTYLMNLQCEWEANSEDLQGNYSETITTTLTVGDGI